MNDWVVQQSFIYILFRSSAITIEERIKDDTTLVVTKHVPNKHLLLQDYYIVALAQLILFPHEVLIKIMPSVGWKFFPEVANAERTSSFFKS